MSTIHWLSDIDGSFGTAADWSGGVVPGASDTAVLKAPGSPFTVTANVSETVEGIRLARNATLDITGGTFTALAGTGAGANAGHISVGAGANFGIGNTLDNIGGIKLQGTSQAGANLLLTANTTLSGGGTVTLGGGAAGHYQMINAAAGVGTVTLTNVDNTISGSGAIVGYDTGAQSLILVNQTNGVIGGSSDNAQEVLALTPLGFPGRSSVINTGLIEARGGASIVINNTDVSGLGGRISANENISGHVTYITLNNCSVVGQVFESESQCDIEFVQSSVTTGGNIQNAGEIFGLSSNLTLDENTTLSGGGLVDISTTARNTPASVVSGTNSSIVLTNVDNQITVDGSLGGGKLDLVNEVAGTIEGGKLTIDTGANTIINAGLIEVIQGTGGIRSPVDNTGVIAVDGKSLTVNRAVSGSGQARIVVGTLDFASSFSQNVTFAGTVGVLELARSQAYAAAITGFSATGGTSLDLRDIGFVSTGEATFSGNATSGVLTVTDGTHTAHIALEGDYLASTFTSSSDDHGGTIVVDRSGQASNAPTSPHSFASAMAALAPAPAVVGAPSSHNWRDDRTTLIAPRGQLA